MQKSSNNFNDVNFNAEGKHKTVLKIELSKKHVFSKPRQLIPEKLKTAFDETQRLITFPYGSDEQY